MPQPEISYFCVMEESNRQKKFQEQLQKDLALFCKLVAQKQRANRDSNFGFQGFDHRIDLSLAKVYVSVSLRKKPIQWFLN